MTIIEAIKLQAKLLEWEAPKGLGANLKGYNTGDYIWITNGIVVARIFRPCYMLSVSWHNGIERFTKLTEDAVKGWLTETRFKDKELGMLVRAEAVDTEAWVREKYIKLFDKADKYDVWITPKALWLTEPDTREVVGVIAGIRGVNETLDALRNKKGESNG